MRRRSLLLVCSLLVATLVAPSAGAEDEPPALAGINTVVGSGFAKMFVRLDQSATYDIFSLQVTGAGRYVGFALARDGQFVVGYRMAFCSSVGCDPGTAWTRSSYGRGGASGTGTHLEPGIYTLFLIADGAPVSVRFKLLTVPGEASFQPAPTSGSLFAAYSEQALAPGAEYRVPLFTGGTEVTASGRPGFWVATVANDASIVESRLTWFCRYNGGPPQGDTDPYGPGCPRHDAAKRAEPSGWCDPFSGGLVPTGSWGPNDGSSSSGCGDFLDAGQTVGVGWGVVIAPSPAMAVYVLFLQP